MMLRKTLIALSIAGMSANAFGAAFQLAEHSASGLGRAFAGDAALAENASVVARNPALMSQFNTMQFSVAATYVKPDVSLTGTSAPAYSSASAIDNDSIAPSAIVPAAYVVMPINEKLAFGLGVFSNFGLATEFDADYAAGQLAGNTEITTANLNAALSYQVNEQFTVAAGISYIYAEAKIIRHLGAIGGVLGAPSSTEAANMEGDDYGYGWNLGTTYQPSKGHLFGIHYRAATDLTFSGNYSNELPAALGGLAGASIPGAVALELPATLEFSGSHQLNDTVGLHYSVLWTQWDSFQKLEAFSGTTVVFEKDEKYSNARRYAIGGDYQISPELKLRAGVAYDETPSGEHMSISIPDTNRLWLSAGVSYQLSDSSSIDVGAAYLKGEKQNFTETDNLGGTWEFEAEGNAMLLSAQYNIWF